ncbi:MAG: T9SS type A sorting domain-containing protein [Saprospiraceae bacterium]|nr:T9SS type A sorting domain-containing protein [Saprospiraceae bacterium]
MGRILVLVLLLYSVFLSVGYGQSEAPSCLGETRQHNWDWQYEEDQVLIAPRLLFDVTADVFPLTMYLLDSNMIAFDSVVLHNSLDSVGVPFCIALRQIYHLKLKNDLGSCQTEVRPTGPNFNEYHNLIFNCLDPEVLDPAAYNAAYPPRVVCGDTARYVADWVQIFSCQEGQDTGQIIYRQYTIKIGDSQSYYNDILVVMRLTSPRDTVICYGDIFGDHDKVVTESGLFIDTIGICRCIIPYNITFKDSMQLELNATDDFLCENSVTTIQATQGYASYSWSTGETQSSIEVDSPGIYSVTVKTDAACERSEEIEVDQLSVERDQSLCNISFDTLSGLYRFLFANVHNKGIINYVLMEEDGGDLYPVDSIYVFENPEFFKNISPDHFYQLATIDACGDGPVVSNSGIPHKPVFLTAETLPQGGINLNWTLYEGRPVDHYEIWSLKQGGSDIMLAIVDEQTNNYQISSPGSGGNAFYVQVVFSEEFSCDLYGSLPVSASMSNVRTVPNQRIPRNIGAASLWIYPNPTRDKVFLGNDDEVEVEIRDVTGTIVAKMVTRRELNLAQLSEGLYYLRFNSETEQFFEKIVKL